MGVRLSSYSTAFFYNLRKKLLLRALVLQLEVIPCIHYRLAFCNHLNLKFSPSCNHGNTISLNSLCLYFQSYILPYLNLSLLILTLVYLPINLVPYPLVWLYDKILWMTEPVLMVAEIILALNFVMHCSQRVIEKMEEDDSNLWKVL